MIKKYTKATAKTCLVGVVSLIIGVLGEIAYSIKIFYNSFIRLSNNVFSLNY